MRRIHILLFLLVFVIFQAHAAKTYRWVDPSGVVHYSDSPNPASEDPEADRIKIRAPNVIRAPVVIPPAAGPRPLRAAEEEATDAEMSEAAAAYSAIRVVSPIAGDTLWNIGGTLTVNVQVTPSLRGGHGVVVFLDGRLLTRTPSLSPSITINEVYRGEHTVRAAVRSDDGADLIVSDPITFYVQQARAN